MNKYNAAIIGCGNIAVLYDMPSNTDWILTHAHAYSVNPKIYLCSMVDTDIHKANNATRIWGGKPYYDAEEMLENEEIDIISICVPDKYHKKLLDLCLSYHPKAVFCEKPLTLDNSSAERIINEYANAGIHLAVNFSRRWDVSLITLKNEIESGIHGKVLNAVGIYTKGILHNGSHMISLFNFLFGNIYKILPLSSKVDWNEDDPTLDAYLEFSNETKAHIIGADERCYSIFDIDILCEKSRFRFSQSGHLLTKYDIRDDPMYSGFKELIEVKCIQTGLKNAMMCAVGNIIDTIEGKDNLMCSGADALITQKICMRLIEDYKKCGSNIWKN